MMRKCLAKKVILSHTAGGSVSKTHIHSMVLWTENNNFIVYKWHPRKGDTVFDINPVMTGKAREERVCMANY